MSDLTPAEVLELLPQRRPCRFVDEIIELDSDHALSKYTWTDEDCAGHFPGNPVVPGVKMIALAAQTALAWGIYLTGRTDPGYDAFFTEVDRVVFKKSVRPGETAVCRAAFGKDGSFQSGRMVADVELKFLGGPKDGETIFAGKIAGVWAPKDSEDLA
ncbi:MAG: 3-hydroxyacyl-ACP dehydratase FabZ family protein [Elusimicrobiota bacterium]